MIPIKSAAEIQRMRRACAAAAEVLHGVAVLVMPGRTTAELNEAAGSMIAKLGGKSPFLGYRGYPGNICVSVNEEVVHGIPGKRRIQYGDIVSLDVGIILDGYVGDNATTVAVGAVKPRAQELLQVTEKALLAGIAKARPRLMPLTRVVMPTTRPSTSMSGPPELPGLIRAEVWM